MPLIYLGVFNGFLAGGGGASGVEKRISGIFFGLVETRNPLFYTRKAPPCGRAPCPLFLRTERPLTLRFTALQYGLC
jgi:hypothetical protein